MEKLLTREDDFVNRRKHLEQLSDDELKEKFWSLTEKVVEPLVTIATCHTSPAIERSVLLRMGFSSLEAKVIVDKVIDYGLMGKGAGHVVYKTALLKNISIKEAGLKLIEGQYWTDVLNSFGVIK